MWDTVIYHVLQKKVRIVEFYGIRDLIETVITCVEELRVQCTGS